MDDARAYGMLMPASRPRGSLVPRQKMAWVYEASLGRLPIARLCAVAGQRIEEYSLNSTVYFFLGQWSHALQLGDPLLWLVAATKGLVIMHDTSPSAADSGLQSDSHQFSVLSFSGIELGQDPVF